MLGNAQRIHAQARGERDREREREREGQIEYKCMRQKVRNVLDHGIMILDKHYARERGRERQRQREQMLRQRERMQANVNVSRFEMIVF